METDKYQAMLEVALEEARQGFVEGGIPIGAAIFTHNGDLVSRGRTAIRAFTAKRTPSGARGANAAIAT
jgi:tRNA(Arg) A34 adenosine deaminase TadA